MAKITHAATELKLTDPSLAVNIRNLHSKSGIQNLGALRTTSIPHLLGFQFSVEPGFTGTAKTPDYLDMSDFMPAPPNGSRFESYPIAEQVSAFEHLKRVLMGVMREPRNSKRPLFGRIFQPMIDALRNTDMNNRLDFLQIDFIVRKCNHMVMEWSKLYSNESNEHLLYEDFLALNEAALTIPVTEWLYLGRNQPLIPRKNQIPEKHFVAAPVDDHNLKKQRVNPNGRKRCGKGRREIRKEKTTADIQQHANDAKTDCAATIKADTGSMHQEPPAPSRRGFPPRGLYHHYLQEKAQRAPAQRQAVEDRQRIRTQLHRRNDTRSVRQQVQAHFRHLPFIYENITITVDMPNPPGGLAHQGVPRRRAWSYQPRSKIQF